MSAIGVDHAGVDGVHPDLSGAELARPYTCESIEGAFASGVNRLISPRDTGNAGTYVDAATVTQVLDVRIQELS